jgi:hypothetical protein
MIGLDGGAWRRDVLSELTDIRNKRLFCCAWDVK